jgi:hypothetical protein
MFDLILEVLGAALLIGEAVRFFFADERRSTRVRRPIRSCSEPETGNQSMFDLAMIALGCVSFAILIRYTYACERM